MKEDNSSSIGMVYFLVILFFARTIFDYLNLLIPKWKGIVSIGLCIVGVTISRFCILPFALDMSFIMLVFVYLGNVLRKLNDNNKFIEHKFTGVVSLAVWLSLFFLIYKITGTYFEIAYRRYPLLPISFICALAGSVFALFVSNLLYRKLGLRMLVDGLKYIGSNSIVLFLVHYFDCIWGFAYSHGNWAIVFILRLVIDLIVFIFAVKILDAYKIRKIGTKGEKI